MDVFCDYRRYGINSRRERIVGWIKIPQLRFLFVFRLASLYKNNILLKMLCRHYAIKYGYQINPGTRIGKGLYLGRWGSIVVNPLAVLGENCNLAQGVTIGQTNRGNRQGVPVIGSKVWIGTNAVVVGSIRIGNDVLIAPNSYVNCDVPNHSIVLGNPARIIPRQNATEGYINHIIES